MKNKKRIIMSLLLVMALGLSMFLTACGNKDDDDVEVTVEDKNIVMVLELPSDSDNGVVWSLDQDNALFNCNDVFLVDEGSEDGSGELQSFEFFPVKAGTANLTFTNESTETTYRYECEVSEDLNSISVKSSSGESAGAEVEAPKMLIENN